MPEKKAPIKSKITISDDTQPERMFVEREIPIDKFTTGREMVEVLPSTCDICGYDVTRSNDLPPYAEMDELAQAKVLDVLKEHKKRHPVQHSKAIPESSVSGEWRKKPKFA
ncbi:MAG: hypothetical protein ACXACE_15215 [Candidatus Thorarchaeota archaeon]|jgi:hypothetical protein